VKVRNGPAGVMRLRPTSAEPLPLLSNFQWSEGHSLSKPYDDPTCPHCGQGDFICEHNDVDMYGGLHSRSSVRGFVGAEIGELIRYDKLLCRLCGHYWRVTRSEVIFGADWTFMGRHEDPCYDNLRLCAQHYQEVARRDREHHWLNQLHNANRRAQKRYG
jgi:hypothetical protein